MLSVLTLRSRDFVFQGLRSSFVATEAVQHIRRMRGGAQAHLMRCSDGHFYVVKFRNIFEFSQMRCLPVDWLT
jgi:hypothetical protein